MRSDHAQARPAEICILLSQHTNNKDRPLDDIALHVFEEQQSQGQAQRRILSPHRIESSVRLPSLALIQLCEQSRVTWTLTLGQSPYSNGLHVLARYTPRNPSSQLVIIPSRDRGLFSRDFTIQALAPPGTTVELERIRASLPFSQTVRGQLSSRNAGGHPGNPSHMLNPQYKLVIADTDGSGAPRLQTQTQKKMRLRIEVQGDRDLPWNVKLVYGNGSRVFESVPTPLHSPVHRPPE